MPSRRPAGSRSDSMAGSLVVSGALAMSCRADVRGQAAGRCAAHDVVDLRRGLYAARDYDVEGTVRWRCDAARNRDVVWGARLSGPPGRQARGMDVWPNSLLLVITSSRT